MKRHHHHNKRRKCCRGAVIKSAVLSKALLTTCGGGSPLLVIAAASSSTIIHHRLNQCAVTPLPELSTSDDLSICRYRNNRRQRIKQQHDCLKHIFECRGGDATMDDINNMYPQHTDSTLKQRTNDVISAAATAIQPFTTYHDLNNEVNDVINTSSSSTMSNNNQLQPNRQQENDISQADTFLNQALQSQSIAPPPPPSNQQQHQQQRLMVEFDTQALNSGNSDSRFGNRIRSQIRSRIGNENDWDRVIRQSRRGAALSISLDLSPPNNSGGSGASGGSLDDYGMSNNSYITNQSTTKTTQSTNLSKTTLTTLLITTYTLLRQSTLLLPPLLLSRRILNSTRNAIVDYFRGRIFRTTFTRMERAYLRYYEFPAAIRAVARLASQIGILLVLSVAVRCWMFMILAGDVVGPLVLGMSGVDIRQDIGMVGTSSSGVGGVGSSGLDGGNQFDGILGNVWNVGLPCHQRGRGMAWLCGLIWIGAVVGTGHACTVALSVWGGPLRLQAAAVQAERPKQLLLRAVHHPIKWFREMEEWKHLPDPKITRKDGTRRRRGGGGGGGSRAVDLDPLLFPATWLPLRWIQIFAVAKAFSTDPQNYRWCSPENDRIVIPKLMKQYLIQLALGDEWQRVCLGEKRVGLGILVVLSYFIALVMMVFTAFTLDGGSAAMLIPSVLAAIISGAINVVMFWKRLETRSQKKALEAIGWA